MSQAAQTKPAASARAARAAARNEQREALTAALQAAGLPYASFVGNVPALIQEHQTATAAMAALQEGEAAKAAEAAREAAKAKAAEARRAAVNTASEAEYAAAVAKAEAEADAAVDDMIEALRVGVTKLQAVAIALNTLAHTKGFGVATVEPWFDMGARKLPGELRKHYDKLEAAYKAEGFDGEFSSRWQNIRKAAKVDAGNRRYWGLAPVVVDDSIGAGEGGEGGEGEGGDKAPKAPKTPAQKAVAALRSLSKVIKSAEGDDYAALKGMVPHLTEAARILGHDFATLA